MLVHHADGSFHPVGNVYYVEYNRNGVVWIPDNLDQSIAGEDSRLIVEDFSLDSVGLESLKLRLMEGQKMPDEKIKPAEGRARLVETSGD